MGNERLFVKLNGNGISTHQTAPSERSTTLVLNQETFLISLYSETGCFAFQSSGPFPLLLSKSTWFGLQACILAHSYTACSGIGCILCSVCTLINYFGLCVGNKKKLFQFSLPASHCSFLLYFRHCPQLVDCYPQRPLVDLLVD